jgi:hypothetical protein
MEKFRLDSSVTLWLDSIENVLLDSSVAISLDRSQECDWDRFAKIEIRQ